MRKVIAFLTVLILLMTVLVSCAAPNTTTTATTVTTTQTTAQTTATTAATTTAGKPLKLAFSAVNSDVFNTDIGKGIKSYCDSKGYTYVQTLNNGDTSVAVSDVQSFINQNVDFALVYVIDEGTQKTIKTMCDAAGMKVAFVGLELKGYTTLSGDNKLGGTMCAEAAWKKAQEKWNGNVDLFVTIQCTKYGEINTIRSTAFAETFCKLSGYKSDKVVWLDYDNILDTQKAFAAVLTANPNAKNIVVLGVTDVNQLMGAWNAANAAARQDQLIISGMHVADQSTPGLLVNKPDIWIGQADLIGTTFGQGFGELVDAYVAGENFEGTTKYCPPVWLDAKNVAEYYKVVY